jgi:hypothetical protein
MPLKMTSMPSFSMMPSKMADVQTSEVDAKLAPINVGL